MAASNNDCVIASTHYSAKFNLDALENAIERFRDDFGAGSKVEPSELPMFRSVHVAAIDCELSPLEYDLCWVFTES